MQTFVTLIHILTCLVLILVVLLQAGKGANMGAAFGGSSQTVFGSSGAGTFLGKLTATVAIVFMITSLTLAYMATKGSSSIVERYNAPVTQQESAPASPDATQKQAMPPPATPEKK
ncbi:MAG TPA: preprotein translocase subunit SecG [Smithellaceae bacterium]|jgi:preprotein translocase subunit SecG|nr:preprotein translocase subunit SecG [Smithellaceae bacterium]HNT91035.1 preprotein translocase subunit SecG [Smithellaceae bacterium]HNV64403.1 preprotein translocase subunit SecG [Smithellaceae bacterium]HNZ31737.1 preprotein translocase subunit SecG [Smithellaceae bacterium]HOD30692.1 preprotein translocase subunit SecG [Smithellaceae bacterium]